MKTDEEEYGRSVLAPLREGGGGPRVPSTVDVAKAIEHGRRRVCVRRVLGASGAVAVVLVVAVAVPLTLGALRQAPQRTPERLDAARPSATAAPSPSTPAPPTTCAVQRLPDPDRTGHTIVTGMDPSGRWVFGRNYGDLGGHYQLLIWEGDTVRGVEVPGVDQSLRAANTAGVAVGLSIQGDDMTAWVYDGGTGPATPLRSEAAAEATAIGEDGTIAGVQPIQNGAPVGLPLVWRAPGAIAERLSLPGPEWHGRTVDVAPDGTVVGALSRSLREPPRGFVWAPDGTRIQLPLPTLGTIKTDGFEPFSISTRWITGRAYFVERSGFRWQPVRYDRQTGRFAAYPIKTFAPSAGNASGWLVGQAAEDRPALLTDMGLLALPRVKGLEMHMATAVSDDARVIAGQAFDKQGRVQALRWTCR